VDKAEQPQEAELASCGLLTQEKSAF